MVKPAQTQSMAKMDFSVTDQKISSVLIMFTNRTGIKFSYNADDPVFDEIISYTAKNRSPLIILDELLVNIDRNYKMVGNQVVIFGADVEMEEEQPKEVKEQVVPPVIITKYKNIPVYDTVFITDTLLKIKTDTIYIVDTVVVEKEQPKEIPVNKIKDIPVDSLNKSDSRENGWSGEVFVAPIISDFSLARDDNSFTARSFSLGMEVSKLYDNWNFKGGFKLTQFGEKFDHSYSVTDGGFFVTDTIDEYYTVINTDTSYFYVTDSTWKPVSTHDYNFAINNRIGLLELTLSASYDFYTTSNIRIYGRVGAQVGFLIYKNGIAIPQSSQSEGVNFADLSFATQSISALAGVGMKYRISKEFDLNTEVYYLRYFNDIVKDYPSSTKINGVGIKVGLIYYF